MVFLFSAFLSVGVAQASYQDIITNYSKVYKVKTEYVRYLMGIAKVETNFRNISDDTKTSHGVFQLVYQTARTRCSDVIKKFSHLFEPERNIACGVKIFSEDLGKYQKPELAIAAFNSGMPLICKKTRDYVSKLGNVINCKKGLLINQNYVSKVLKESGLF